jgi:[ribosomal protein S5]-alanine N-acetyltransferase
MNLVPITASLARTPQASRSELLAGICRAVTAMYPGGTPILPWAGYLVQEGEAFIGTCAFKTPPRAGAVEIAYFTFPGYEGRGVATEMALSLVALARRHGVRLVRAQTLPQENASTSILRKLGFTLAGEVMHSTDGRVWEWHLEG